MTVNALTASSVLGNAIQARIFKIRAFLLLFKAGTILFNMKLFIIKADFEKDLKNWIQAVKKGQSHGVTWVNYMPDKIRAQIQGKTNEEIEEIIDDFLKEKYISEEKKIAEYAENLEKVLNDISEEMFSILERITELSIYRDNFTGFITTLGRAPYYTPSGYIWFIYGKDDAWQIRACMHELFHMQFEHYFKERLENQISKEKFAFLREAMTIILNEEAKNITSEIDKGYPAHQEFRTHLLTLWKQRKSFEEFIENAVNDLEKFKF